MDLNHLEDNEVTDLISSNKHFTYRQELLDIQNRVTDLIGKIDFTGSVNDNNFDINYKIKVYRGKRDINRYSIHIRFEDVHHHLVRIDIGSHHNDIKEDHIHIYNKNCEPRSNNVLPISKSNFPLPNDIIDALDKFLDYNNIQ